VSKLFGAFREADGFSERANILIDENGTIVFTRLYPTGQLPDIQEIINFLKK